MQLKEVLDTEKYSAMAHRLIKFDEDMTSIAQTWINVWSLIQEFHSTSEDMERRQRIISLHSLLVGIKNNAVDIPMDVDDIDENNVHPTADWIQMDNRDKAWALVLKHLQQLDDVMQSQRITSVVQNSHCTKCSHALASHYVYVLHATNEFGIRIYFYILFSIFFLQRL